MIPAGIDARARVFGRWAWVLLCLWTTAWSLHRVDSITAQAEHRCVAPCEDERDPALPVPCGLAVEPSEEAPDDGDLAPSVQLSAGGGSVQRSIAAGTELCIPSSRDRGDARRHNRGPPIA